MSLPITRQAYADCEAIFERASLAPHGIRIRQASYGYAVMLRMRMHKFRTILRELNAQTYEIGHKMYAASEFDNFSVRLREDAAGIHWVYVEPYEPPPDASIEELSEVRASQLLPSRESQVIDAEVVEGPPAPLQITVRRI